MAAAPRPALIGHVRPWSGALWMAVVLVAGCGTAAPAPSGGDGEVEGIEARVESPAAVDTMVGEPQAIALFPGVLVQLDPPRVELEAIVCIEAGWLEQVACAAGTREHESLMVPRAQPSEIHGALLMAGFEAGAPGTWSYDDGNFTFQPPTGTALDILVEYEDAAGNVVVEDVRRWIRDHHGENEFPSDPWIFAGSRFVKNPEWMAPGEHYVADQTGSIIGLVTFGDEVIGFSRVLADEDVVRQPEWEAHWERMPPVGTVVRIIIQGCR